MKQQKARANTKPLSNPYKYTDEEIAQIEADKKKEVMRGNQPRYWEDVNEGDRWSRRSRPWTIMSYFAWNFRRRDERHPVPAACHRAAFMIPGSTPGRP